MRVRSLVNIVAQARRHASTAIPRISVAKALEAAKSETPQDVSLDGFVRTVRRSKNVAFVSVGDGSTVESIQSVLTKEQAAGLSAGSAISIEGIWKAIPGQEQSHELVAKAVKQYGPIDPGSYPIQKKYQTPEFLRTLPHLRCRMPFNALLLQFRSQAIGSATNYFNQHDFTQTQTPIVTSSDCEGAGEVFTLSSRRVEEVIKDPSSPETTKLVPLPKDSDKLTTGFFRKKKHLTVSAQLHLEALCHSIPRVWTLSPSFRAEKSDTPRHLSEFYMLEAEVAFTYGLGDVTAVVEGLVRSVVRDLQSSRVGQELLRAKRDGQSGLVSEAEDLPAPELPSRWSGILSSQSWPRLTYTEAVELLQKMDVPLAPSWGDSFTVEHERYVATHFGENGKSPVFVTRYPKAMKPFYMLPSPGCQPGRETVECFDLLLPDYGELVGGSLREHRYRELEAAMKANGVDTAALAWYLDLRKYGSVPHGGFGLGWDRLLAYLSGVPSVRDVVSWPRWFGRCDG